MLRLFFAVELSEEARDAVSRVQTELRGLLGDSDIRWVGREQFHYTLKFLGETPETDLPAVIAAGYAVAAQVEPFSLTPGGWGVFPRQRHPKILWIGAAKGLPLLTRLAESLDRELSEHGFAPETHRYNAHLTLARMRSEEGEEAVAKQFQTDRSAEALTAEIAPVIVTRFVLIESELTPRGPMYTVRETFPLKTL